MAAVTEPAYHFPPPEAPERGRRRRLLVAGVVAWILVVAGLAWWSVRHDPATVADQRDLGQALPELQRAAGVVVAAAGGDGRAAVLGELRLEDCTVTPVRAGAVAARDVTVYVPDGEARGALDVVAAGLPESYRAAVSTGRGGARFALHADAGKFIGIDARAAADDRSLTLSVSSGCRPLPAGTLDQADPSAGEPPAVLANVLAALNTAAPGAATSSPASPSPATSSPAAPSPATPSPATSGAATVATAVKCPNGATAATFTLDGPANTRHVGQALRDVAAGAAGGQIIRDDPDSWVFRSGNDSVIVLRDGERLRVVATRGC
jgi:hypothetical protein